MSDPTPPVLIPSPDTGAGGFRGWVRSHFLPFRNSLAAFVSSPEFGKVEQTAIASGSFAGALAAILWGLSPFLQDQAGPWFAPFIAAAVGWIATHLGVRSKLGDSTDGDGNHAQAAIVPERDNRLRPYDPGGHGAA